MAKLPKFFDNIKREVVDPAIKDIDPFESGYVIASYYEAMNSGIESDMYSSNAFCDIMVTSSGDITKTYKRVPLLRIGGISPALPPIGSTAIVAHVGGRSGTKVMMGWYDSEISTRYENDNIVPSVLPRIPKR